MSAEFLHKKIWFRAKDSDQPARRWHLIIRRTPKDNGGWSYKYSLSNASLETRTQRLAYQQSQRFWVEQALRDVKDGLGMDEYQVRKWAGWHHHVALTMLAGLFVLKTRLENRDDMPLLSISDVRDIMAFVLPFRIQTLSDLLKVIKGRHIAREKSYQLAKRRKSPRWANNRVRDAM